jgi:predicted MFS family arabinose efflux permease
MLLGSVVIGPWSDRIGPFRATESGLLIFVVTSALLTVTEVTAGVGLGLLLIASLIFGVCNTLDLTGRKSLLAQQSRLYHRPLLTMETASMAGCQAAGPALAGLLIARTGPTAVFAGITAAALTAWVLLRVSNSGSLPIPEESSDVPTGSSRRPRRAKRLRIVLLVTVLMNIGYYSHVSLIPALASKYSGSAAVAGLLGSSSGLGMAFGAILLLSVLRHWDSWPVYFFGSVFALTALAAAAMANSTPLAMLCLALAGAGISGFVTMQTVLVSESAKPEALGEAMGQMSTAIGVLPLSMISLGAVADLLSPSVAIFGASLVTLSMLCVVGLRAQKSGPAVDALVV